MLVLSRKRNESIVIDNRIKIFVVEIRGDKVRLGIEAPGNIPVHRQEIWAQIQTAGIDRKQKELNPSVDATV